MSYMSSICSLANFMDCWVVSIRLSLTFLPCITNSRTGLRILKYHLLISRSSRSVNYYKQPSLGQIIYFPSYKNKRRISASTDGGPCSRVCTRLTLHSAPHLHQRKFPAHMSGREGQICSEIFFDQSSRHFRQF